MKNFRICNLNAEDWKECYCMYSCDCVSFIKRNKCTSFEISWKSPLYRDTYIVILRVEDGIITFKHEYLELPKTLLKLGKEVSKYASVNE